MLLHFGYAHTRNEVSPESDNAGREAVIRQMLDANVRHVKVGGIDGLVFAVPGIAGLVGAAFIEWLHVRIEAGNNLDRGEAFLHTICG